MFDTINRDVLIIFPKQPLIDWVNYIYPKDKMQCPKPMENDEGDIFLIPEFYHPDDADNYLKENYLNFFHHELNDWTTEESLWPENLTWELFEKWFHYSIQSVVMDTVDDEIEKDNFFE